MKKVLLLAALVLGTTAMVSAQTEPMKNAPAKEVKSSKHSKHHEKKEMKAPEAKASNEKK